MGTVGAQIGFLKGLDDSSVLRDHKALNSQSRWKALRRGTAGQKGVSRGIFRERPVRTTEGFGADGSSSLGRFVLAEQDSAG